MEVVPQLWIVAGPNGAGETTSVQKEPIASILPRVPFFNPDDRTLQKLRAEGFKGFADAPFDIQTRLFIESANEVFNELKIVLDSGQSVGVETVLSSEKYRPLVETVNACDGIFCLIYVALSSPDISRRRIAARVQRGGHGVPEAKIALRWQRSLDYLPWFARRATSFWVVDNSDSNRANAPKLLASGKNGRLEFLNSDAFPEMKAALASLPTSPPQ